MVILFSREKERKKEGTIFKLWYPCTLYWPFLFCYTSLPCSLRYVHIGFLMLSVIYYVPSLSWGLTLAGMRISDPFSISLSLFSLCLSVFNFFGPSWGKPTFAWFKLKIMYKDISNSTIYVNLMSDGRVVLVPSELFSPTSSFVFLTFSLVLTSFTVHFHA